MESFHNLHDFETIIKEFITKSNYNVTLSGVACLYDSLHTSYSVSYIVEGPGPVPIVSKSNVQHAQAAFQRIVPDQCTFLKLQALNYIMVTPLGEKRGKRWQVIYRFRQQQH